MNSVDVVVEDRVQEPSSYSKYSSPFCVPCFLHVYDLHPGSMVLLIIPLSSIEVDIMDSFRMVVAMFPGCYPPLTPLPCFCFGESNSKKTVLYNARSMRRSNGVTLKHRSMPCNT